MSTKDDFLNLYLSKPERIIFSEATIEPQNPIEKTVYSDTYKATGNRAAAMTGVDALRRVKKMGFSPVEMIKHLAGASGKARGPMKFLIGYRPFAGPFRDTRFVLALTLKRYSGNQVRWGFDFTTQNQPSRSCEMEYDITGDAFQFGFSTPMYQLPGGFKIPPQFISTGPMSSKEFAQDRTLTTTRTRRYLPRHARRVELPGWFAMQNEFERHNVEKMRGEGFKEPRKWVSFAQNPHWAYLSFGRGRHVFDPNEVYKTLPGSGEDHNKAYRDKNVRLRYAFIGRYEVGPGKVIQVYPGMPVAQDHFKYWRTMGAGK